MFPVDDSTTTVQWLHHAVVLQSEGRLNEATDIYETILRSEPLHPDALNLLGLVEMSRGDYQRSKELIKKAVSIFPNSSSFWGNLGVVNRFAGQIDDAILAYQRSIELDPANPDAHLNLGKSLKLKGRLADAKLSFRRALEIDPQRPSPWLCLMSLCVEERELETARKIGEEAVVIIPRHFELWLSLGAVNKRLNRLNEAILNYQQAIGMCPTNVDVLCRLASILMSRYQIAEGRAYLEQAMALDSNSVHVLNCIGLLHNTMGDTTSAIRVFTETLDRYPDNATAFANLSKSLKKRGELSAALDKIAHARDLEPAKVENVVIEAGVLTSLGRLTDADRCFRQAIELGQGCRAAHDGLLMCMQYRPESTPDLILKEHNRWNNLYASPMRSPIEFQRLKRRNRPLRLGFVSADLGAHPVGYFTANLFKHLDRKEFETQVYSDRADRDWLSEEIRKNVDRWFDSTCVCDATLADKILNDEIDILFDLAGHTANNRLLVFAKRVAPIQVSWAGYVGTTGLTEMDFVLGDIHHIPQGSEKYFSERILRMPHGYVSYYPLEATPDVNSLPALSNGYFTFGAMCNPAKVNDCVLTTWAEILSSIPSSRLIVSYCGWKDLSNQDRVIDVFRRYGCHQQVDFFHMPTTLDLLRLYNNVDVALDTFPYNGGLTTIEALWMGIPTITCPGQWFSGRHSLSHLSNVGHNDWVVSNLEEYVRRAQRAARELASLARVRETLRDTMRKSPLCDGNGFAEDFGSLMQSVWRDWLKA